MSELLLNKTIYYEESIEKAMTAFSGFGHFSMKEDTQYYKVLLTDTVYDLELTMKEFENYLIDLSVKDKKWQ